MILHKNSFRQKGASMIEVLITMIVVALGLLGHASLIAVSAKDNNTAYMRSQATLLAHDILERLRLNPVKAKAGDFNIAIGTAPDNDTNIENIELNNWRDNINQALPGGTGSVSVDGAGNTTIVIRWDEVVKGDANGAGTTSFTTQSVI
jgi:type IV pilus assembly protein PilV